MKINPYSSVSVVWMELERHPRSWFYSYDQMDNNCSPWDLQLSQYVLPENVHKMPLPPSLLKKNVTADAILLHLKRFGITNFSWPFTAMIWWNDWVSAKWPKILLSFFCTTVQLWFFFSIYVQPHKHRWVLWNVSAHRRQIRLSRDHQTLPRWAVSDGNRVRGTLRWSCSHVQKRKAIQQWQ